MKYFTFQELCRSARAEKLGIENIPNEIQRLNLQSLVENLLDHVRASFGKPIHISSGFRCDALNSSIGGVKGSQHSMGQAVDIVTNQGKLSNKALFDLILKGGFDFDQLIYEKGDDIGPEWIHVSYKSHAANRKQVLRTIDGSKYFIYK